MKKLNPKDYEKLKRERIEKQRILDLQLKEREEKLYPIAILVDLLIIICAAIMAGLVLTLRYKTKYMDHKLLEEIGINWSRQPILNIYTDNNCKTPLITDKWQGIVDGCICESGKSFIYYPKKSCPEYLPLKCKPYTNVSRPQLNIWKEQILCAEYMNLFNYLNLDVVKDSTQCAKINKKSCGIIDTKGNILCIDNNKNCPINDFFIGDSEMIADTKGINLLNKNISFFNNIKNGTILTQFKIADDVPCIDPYYINNNQTFFPMDTYYGRDICSDINGKKYDDSFIYLDSYPKYLLYSENDVMPIIKNITGYPSNIFTNNANLYAKTYAGISTECRESISIYPNLLNMMINLPTTITMINDMGLQIILIPLAIGLVISTITTYWFYFRIKNKLKSSDIPIRVFADCSVVVAMITAFVVILIKIPILKSYVDLFKTITMPYCFDSEYYTMLNQMYEELKTIKNYMTALVILSAIGAGSYMIHFLILCYSKLKSIDFRNEYEKIRKFINI